MSDAESFVDPYVYPGTSILRNLLDKQTKEQLDLAEYRLTWARRIELDENPIVGAFDFKRLKETHRRLFQDIYKWAGQPRTVEINKNGSQFHLSPYIATAAAQTFEWLAESNLLDRDVADDRFVEVAADLLEKINYIHPFREGNGRTQRAFLDQVADVSGRSLSWRNIAPEDHLRAAVNAFRDGHGEAFRSVIRQAMRPPIDGLSRLDPATYAVSSPAVVSSAANLKDRFTKYPELRDLRLAPPGAKSRSELFDDNTRFDPDEPQFN